MKPLPALSVFLLLAFQAPGESPSEALGPPAGPAAEPAEVIVTVNGVPIREEQIIEEADHRIDAENARAAAMGLVFEESARGGARQFIRQDVIHTLIERELIAQRLEADKIEVSDDEVRERLRGKARELEQSERATPFDIASLTARSARERVRWNVLGVEKLYQAHATDKRTLTEDEALQEYERFPAEFDVPEKRRVSHILFAADPESSSDRREAARAKAEAVLKRVLAGEDFAELAKARSEDSTTRMRGGDRGWSTRGFITSPADDPFGNTAFSMQHVGEISGVVETKDGYHIIQLTGVKPARRKPFEEAKRELMAKFKYLEIERFWQEFGRELWTNAVIQTTPAEKLRYAAAEKRQQEFNQRVETMIAREQEKQRQESNAEPTPPTAASAKP